MSAIASSQSHAQACNGGGCGGDSCSKPSERVPDAKPEAGSAKLCIKCRERPAEVLGQNLYPLCFPCQHGKLLGKAQAAARVKGPLRAGDVVAVAYSGSPASAATTCMLKTMRSTRQDRREGGKTCFSMRLLHVDESAVQGLCGEESEAAAAAVAAAAEQHAADGVTFHCIPLEDVFSPEIATPGGRRERLARLLQNVTDPTGRADLVRHLRMHLLLGTASEMGCNRLAMAHTSTALAARLIAASAKGCGYSLPGDVQATDGRYGPGRPTVFYPLREIGEHDLGTLVQHLGLGSVAQRAATSADKRNINVLAAGFVQAVQDKNPSGVSNILSVAAKLQAFAWDHGKGGEGAEVLCPLCFAPLADDELPGRQGEAEKRAAVLCNSCTSQVAAPLGGSSGSEAGAGLEDYLPVSISTGMAALSTASALVSAQGGAGRVLSPAELRAAIADCML